MNLLLALPWIDDAPIDRSINLRAVCMNNGAVWKYFSLPILEKNIRPL